MKKPELCALAAALTVALAGLMSILAARANGALAAAQRRNTTLSQQIQSRSDNLESSKRECLGLKKTLAELTARQAAFRKAQGGPKAALLVTADAGLHALYLKAYRERTHFQHLGFYRESGLSEEQIEKFEDLMVGHEDRRLDIQATAAQDGLAPSDPAIAKLQKENDTQLQVAQAELLGQAGYQESQQYDRAQPLDNITMDISRSGSYQAGPLTLAQEQDLNQALAAASPDFQAGGAIDPASINVGQALAQSAKFLSPAQAEVLNEELQVVPVLAMIKQFYQNQPPPK